MDIGFDKMSPEEKFKILLKFVKDCGININTGTRARGHQGFFMKNRIDISKTLDTQRKIEVLVHEFAHYAHCLIEPDAARSHGSLKTIFKADNTDEILKELLAVTRFTEKNTVLSRLEEMKLKEKGVELCGDLVAVPDADFGHDKRHYISGVASIGFYHFKM